MLYIGGTLVAIATEIEHTAERFCEDKSYFDSNSRCIGFNLVRERSENRKEIVAATGGILDPGRCTSRYRCVGNLASR